MKFPEPLCANGKAAGRAFVFEDTESLLQWARSESVVWSGELKSELPFLESAWNEQVQYFQGIINLAEQFEKTGAVPTFEKLRNRFREKLESGMVLTTSHHFSEYILKLAKEDPGHAGLVLISRFPQNKLYETVSQNLPLICCGILNSIVAGSELEVGSKSIESVRREIGKQQHVIDSQRAEVSSWLGSERTRFNEFAAEQKEAVAKWSQERDERLKDLEVRWENLKDFVHKDLATSAPVSYWNTRAKECRTAARVWALVLGGVLILSSFVFFAWGVPFLGGTKTSPALAQLLPVVVPMFFAVWILRIISRLLSDNLSLMRDADERRTMIQAFLALTREKGSDKPLIQSEDRLLILSALFRPSPLNAGDDSPPVSVLEPLLKHVKK